MRFLPTRVHGVIDYLWGVALMATPWIFAVPKGSGAMWFAWFLGAGAVMYSLATDYELGAVRLIPVPLHLGLDAIAGAILAASPWLFGFADQARWPYLFFGLFAVVASLVTKTRPTPGP